MTILLARFVALSKSFEAPVVTCPKIAFSHMYPPSREHISSSNFDFEWRCFSSPGMNHVEPRDIPLDMIDIFLTLSQPSSMLPTTACPTSWYAVISFSFFDRTLDFLSGPIRTFSIDCSTSFMWTFFWFFFAARIAASFIKFSRSAPVNPGVWRAIFSKSTDEARGLFRECTSRICSRALRSGLSTITLRSNRPGRSRAGSSTSGRFVAAITMTFVPVSKPSISLRIWLSVCSLSSWPPPIPAPLCLPTASISSMKIMHGEFLFAFLNRSLTREAPTPTNISTNSEPDIVKNGTSASPATALASRVLPVPGGPISNTPFGIFAPIEVYFCGFFRKSTISSSSAFASFTPATLLKFVFSFSLSTIFAFDFPKPIAWLFEFWAERIMNKKNPIININGRKLIKRSIQNLSPAVSSIVTESVAIVSSFTPVFSKIEYMSAPGSFWDVCFLPSASSIWIVLSANTTW